MAVRRKYTETVELGAISGWELLSDVTEELRRHFGLSRLSGDMRMDAGVVSFRPSKELSAEHPYRTDRDRVLLRFEMDRTRPFAPSMNALFRWDVGMVCRISGSKQKEVLGVAESLRRFVARWQQTPKPEPRASWWQDQTKVAWVSIGVAVATAVIGWLLFR